MMKSSKSKRKVVKFTDLSGSIIRQIMEGRLKGTSKHLDKWKGTLKYLAVCQATRNALLPAIYGYFICHVQTILNYGRMMRVMDTVGNGCYCNLECECTMDNKTNDRILKELRYDEIRSNGSLIVQNKLQHLVKQVHIRDCESFGNVIAKDMVGHIDLDSEKSKALIEIHRALYVDGIPNQPEWESYDYGEVLKCTSDIIAQKFNNVQSVVFRGAELEEAYSLFIKRLPYSFAVSLNRERHKNQHLTVTHIFDNCVSEFKVDLSSLLQNGLLQSMVSLNHSQNLYPFLWHELAKDKYKISELPDSQKSPKEKNMFGKDFIMCKKLEHLVLRQQNDFQNNSFNSIGNAPLIFPKLKYMEVSKFGLSASELASIALMPLLCTFVYEEKLPKMQLVSEVNLSKLDAVKLTPILTDQDPFDISESLNQIFSGKAKIQYVEATIDISEHALDFSHLSLPDVTHLSVIGDQDALKILKCASKTQRLQHLELKLNSPLSLSHLTSVLSATHASISCNHSLKSIAIKSEKKRIKWWDPEAELAKKLLKKIFTGLKDIKGVF
ncbi:hypothetical protein LPJ68_002065 [Coemansia sp. RSA 1086]|nr:hypothetical protein LPJ68_002065 [Coemansia sp. RSA 1086]